jgi:hypothetical protein
MCVKEPVGGIEERNLNHKAHKDHEEVGADLRAKRSLN